MEEAGPEVQWAGFGRLKERPSLRRRKAVPAHWRWAKFDETLLLLLRREVGPARRSGAGQSEWARPSVSGEAGPGPSRARSSRGRRESGDRRAPRSGAGPAGVGAVPAPGGGAYSEHPPATWFCPSWSGPRRSVPSAPVALAESARWETRKGRKRPGPSQRR